MIFIVLYCIFSELNLSSLASNVADYCWLLLIICTTHNAVQKMSTYVAQHPQKLINSCLRKVVFGSKWINLVLQPGNLEIASALRCNLSLYFADSSPGAWTPFCTTPHNGFGYRWRNQMSPVLFVQKCLPVLEQRLDKKIEPLLKTFALPAHSIVGSCGAEGCFCTLRRFCLRHGLGHYPCHWAQCSPSGLFGQVITVV